MRNYLRNVAAACTLLTISLGVRAAAAQVVLSGGTIHTGAGETYENAKIVLNADGTIGAVGANVAVPANAEVVDVTGKVVTAGLVDPYTRIGLVEIGAVAGTRDADPGPIDGERDPIRAAFRVTDAINPYSANIAVQRAGGVTSAVVVPSGGIIAGRGAVVDLAGEDADATVVEPEAVMFVQGGQQASSSRGLTMLRLREVFDDARVYAESPERYDENRMRALAASRLDLIALEEAAERPVYFEVHRAADIRAVLAFSRALDLEPVIVGGTEAWMVADELARDDAVVIVQPIHNLPWSFDRLAVRDDNATRLAKRGVRVAVSAFDTHQVRNLRFLAGNAIREGLDREAALRAVTVNAAAAAGVADRYGTLEAGKVANVVVWSGDPFEFSTRAEAIYVRGEPVTLENRQTKLFERYRELRRRGEVPAPRPREGASSSDPTPAKER